MMLGGAQSQSGRNTRQKNLFCPTRKKHFALSFRQQPHRCTTELPITDCFINAKDINILVVGRIYFLRGCRILVLLGKINTKKTI
jgi:hypothetical protein